MKVTPRQLEDVGPVRRQEVVDDDDRRGAAPKQGADEVAAHEPGAADDERAGVPDRGPGHARSCSSFRWVYVSVMPKVR
jgi:hypothetical protein